MNKMFLIIIGMIVIAGIIWFLTNGKGPLNFLKTNPSSHQVSEDNNVDSLQGDDTVSMQSLKTCTNELYSADCTLYEKKPVCSTDVLVKAKGNEEKRQTEYISACNYCKFFGPDNTVNFGDEKLVTYGYREGSCIK